MYLYTCVLSNLVFGCLQIKPVNLPNIKTMMVSLIWKCVKLAAYFGFISIFFEMFGVLNFEMLILSLSLAHHIYLNAVSRQNYLRSQTHFSNIYGVVFMHRLFSEYLPSMYQTERMEVSSELYPLIETTYLYGISHSYLFILVFCVLLGILFAQEEHHPYVFMTGKWRQISQYNYFEREQELESDVGEVCLICCKFIDDGADLKRFEEMGIMNEYDEDEMEQMEPMLKKNVEDKGTHEAEKSKVLNVDEQCCETWKKNVGDASVLGYLERSIEASDVMETPCNHVFHTRCLLTWMRRKFACPNCRLRLPDFVEEFYKPKYK